MALGWGWWYGASRLDGWFRGGGGVRGCGGKVGVGGVGAAPSSGEAAMHAGLGLLCAAGCCTAGDLLPESSNKRRRQLTDAEVVTLAVA